MADAVASPPNKRPKLLETWKEQVACYISFKYGVSKEQALEMAKEIGRENYKPLTAIIEETKIDGQPIIKGVDLASWFDKQSDNIITPSGSVYCQHTKKTGTIINMLLEYLAKRKKEKKLMLKCKAAGDKTGQLIHYYAQTLTKIFINALPGNFGSRYSIFYDKGNYNAITSCGRSLIAFAYTEIEAVLGGNFMWLSIDDLMMHIISQIHAGIDEDKVNAVCTKYNLARKTKEDLYEFYKKELNTYNRYTDYMHKHDDSVKHAKMRDNFEYNHLDRIKKSNDTITYVRNNPHDNRDLSKIMDLIANMNDAQVQYFYYFENFRHIIMENDATFRKIFNDMFNYDMVPMDDTVDPEKLFELDGALVIMCNVAFHRYVDPGDSEIQVYDLPKKRTDLAKKFICIAQYVANKLKDLDDILDAFVYTKICRQNVENQQLLYRNTAVVSDTDSVIFTAKDWVKWYTGSMYSINEDAYNIAMLMVYWITKAVAHAMYKFSEAHGARDQYLHTIAMKNEFLYPVMTQADVKKHYAGVITVQEGVILPKPDVDIKGGQFRGSKVPKEALRFAEKFSNDLTMEIYEHGQVDAHEVISKIRAFEERIFNELQAGVTEWLPAMSVKTKDKYANPMGSPWYYYYVWQNVFSAKYGDIIPPLKTPAVPVLAPTESYWSWLRDQDKDIHDRFVKFLSSKDERGTLHKWPSSIVINPVGGKVPPELIPLIRVKDIIKSSVMPCHLLLRQIPINCGFDDDNNLFSDDYPIVKGKKHG